VASGEPAPFRNRRIQVALACSVCGSRNYLTKKPPRDGGMVLKLKKFCSGCKRHTEHIEGR
jgi:large subunit ribosomal protein L33